MATGHDYALGPEVEGMRITVHTLLPHFLDPTATEAYICQVYGLKPEQVAAARAYVLNNPDVVLGEYVQIEERLAKGNSKEVIETANEARVRLQRFKEWLDQEERSAEADESQSNFGTEPRRRLTFKQWLTEQASRTENGS